MSTSSSPTSSRRERNATCTTPSAASAPDPAASFTAGTPKRTTAGIPRSARTRTSLQALLGVLEDARHRRHRLGGVDALLHEERSDEVVHGDVCFADQSTQRRRATQPPRPVLGKRHAARVPPGPRRPGASDAYAPA